jgi:hypothetical protein
MEQGEMVLSNFHQTLFCQLPQAFCPVLSENLDIFDWAQSQYVPHPSLSNQIQSATKTIEALGRNIRTDRRPMDFW